MNLVQKHQSIERANSDRCIITEYPMDNSPMNFAIAKINGRYPESKQATNLVCDEIVHVNAASGSVTVNGVKHFLSAGDTVLIEAGEKFLWEGDLHLYISCTPMFTVEQHQIVEIMNP